MGGQVKEWGSPVERLDQLYAQAEGVNLVLRPKLLPWAGVTKAWMRSAGGQTPGGWAQWDTAAAAVPGAVDWVAWADLKRADLAVDEVIAVHQGEVARLVDVCRHTLAFDSLALLADCLETISKDPDIKVERIWNHFATPEDPSSSFNPRYASSAPPLHSHGMPPPLVHAPSTHIVSHESTLLS